MPARPIRRHGSTHAPPRNTWAAARCHRRLPIFLCGVRFPGGPLPNGNAQHASAGRYHRRLPNRDRINPFARLQMPRVGIGDSDMATMRRPPAQQPEFQCSETPEATSPLLLSARDAASLCGKSLRTWRSWDSAGRIPRPVRINRSTLWRFDELQKWVEAGCPRREEWEART